MTVEYLPFATGGGASVMPQATYAADAPNGVVPGVADPTFANKVWRQASVMSAALANLIATELTTNVLDDGNVSALQAQLLATITAIAGVPPTRTVLNGGSGNYTPPVGVKLLRIRMVGGGGSGGASGNNGVASNLGGNTANPGAGGVTAVTGGAGGTGGSGTPTNAMRIAGGAGLNGTTINLGANTITPVPAAGAPGPWGKGGYGAGGDGPAISITSAATLGGGGGSGEYVEFDVDSPGSSPIAYIVGAGGASPGGTSKAGVGGVIIIDEYYA